MEKTNCSNCDAEIEKYPCDLKENNFCSHECHTEWRTGSNNHFWNGGKKEYKCDNCGELTKRYDSQVRGEKAYCSPECQIEGQKIEGYDSHFYTKSNWVSKREEIRERDDNECQWCGNDNRRLAVHHIRPIRLGGAILDNSNLVTLCNRCHGWAHKAISD